ncbi:MAG: acyl-CoA carboxylase subunit beta [Deltaproteobacteria bacterium]|nr:acyl-CoA carboxylase subunit beta [Deltaproteobacteria bacterium]
MSLDEKLTELAERRERLKLGGGADAIAKQHAAGRSTARERVALLADPETFHELGLFARHRATHFGMESREVPADAVVTGSVQVDQRPVFVASQDFTASGGSAGEVHCNKIVETMNLAMKTGSPFVFINDSGGARVQEGIDGLAGYARVFRTNVMLSGVVPQISIVAGPCAGGAAYSPALTDFIIHVKGAQMFITGPQVIKQVTGEVVSADALGGPDAQTASGVVHFIARDDAHAIEICRALLSFLPANNLEDPPRRPWDEDIPPDPTFREVVPGDPKQAYDVRAVVALTVDRGEFLEVQPGFAPNLVVGFGRVAGQPVGVVANQPSVLAGALDIDASDKASRFIRFCNAFNVPLLSFVDVPGFLPGVEQERGGIIRHGAKMLFAFAAATVPKVTVVLRKAYGGAFVAMCSKDLGADRVYAWPTAEIAVMGPEGASEIVFRREIAAAADPAAKRRELTDEYRKAFLSPFLAAARAQADDIIDPADTRRFVAIALDTLGTKRELRPAKKHGLIPL